MVVRKVVRRLKLTFRGGEGRDTSPSWHQNLPRLLSCLPTKLNLILKKRVIFYDLKIASFFPPSHSNISIILELSFINLAVLVFISSHLTPQKPTFDIYPSNMILCSINGQAARASAQLRPHERCRIPVCISSCARSVGNFHVCSSRASIHFRT